MDSRSILLFLIALFLCLFISNILRSQSEVDVLGGHATTYQQVVESDELPTFPGESSTSSNYLKENLQHPLAGRENAIEEDARVGLGAGKNGNSPEPVILDMEVMRK